MSQRRGDACGTEFNSTDDNKYDFYFIFFEKVCVETETNLVEH